MPSRNKAVQFAAALLTPQHVSIAEEIINKHLTAAMAKGDVARVRELSELLGIADSVKAEGA